MKAGFISIIGRPNSGKSTLVNQLVGSYLSIVTPKAQTTRKNITAVLTENNYQIILLDTPGILKPEHKLHETMLEQIKKSIDDADVLVILIDGLKFNNLKFYLNSRFYELVSTSKKPTLAAINKIDLINDNTIIEKLINELKKETFLNETFAISAILGTNIDLLKDTIVKYLPESDFFYEDDLISTLPIKFFVAEIIRENIYKLFSEEIPYSTEVSIREFKERSLGKWYILAEIIVEKSSQKKIIIGKNGDKIKELGKIAREQIQEYLHKEIYLELFVKTRKNWRKNITYLKSFGYLK